MLGGFNDVEALEIGLNLERDGITFYTTAAEASEDSELTEMYLKLAADEKEHYEKFSQAREEMISTDYRDSSEVSSYLNRLVQMGIFAPQGSLTAKVKEAKNPRQVIEMAIQAEKDGMLFYTLAADMSENPKGKKLFRWLLGEEKHHLKFLGEMYEKLG